MLSNLKIYSDSKQEAYKSIVIFCVSFIFLALGSNFGINIYDEGVGIVGANRILQSELPYKDFWLIYSPLWLYIQAGFIKIFGSQLLCIRLFTIFISSFSVLIVYKIARIRSKNALFAPTASLMIISLAPMYARATPLAVMVSLLIIYLLINNKSSYHYLAISALLPLLFAVRHDFGVYFFFVVAINYYFEYKSGEVASLRNPIISLLLALALLLVYFQILSCYSMLNKFYEYSIEFVLNKFSSSRSLPLPNPLSAAASGGGLQSIIFSVWQSLMFYAPVVIIFTSLSLFIKKKNAFAEEKKLLFATLSASTVLLMHAATRSEFEHILPSLLFALPAVQTLVAQAKRPSKYLIIALLAFFTIIPLAKKAQSFNNAYFSHNSIAINSNVAKGIKVDKAFGGEYNKLLDFLSENCKDEYIYSGCSSHDRIFINDIMLYYLAQKKSPTKYHELHPKQATEYAIQNDIINSLHNKKVRFAILYDSDTFEPNASSLSSNIFILDDFINDNYKLIAEYGKYYVFELKQAIGSKQNIAN